MPVASCFRLLGVIADLASSLQIRVISMPNERSSSRAWMRIVFMRLPKGCGEISSKLVALNRETGVEIVAHAPGQSPEEYRILSSTPLTCVMRLIELGSVSISTVVVHVDGTLAGGRDCRCDHI